MKAFSPITRPVLCTSPSMRPSICTSPVEFSVPLIVRSALMMEGAEARGARFGGCGGGAAGAATETTSLSLFLLENMTPRLDKCARILQIIGQPYFVVHMRTRAAPRRSKLPDGRAFFHSITNFDQDR